MDEKIKDGYGGEIRDISGMIFMGDDGKKYQMPGRSYAIYSPQKGGYYAFDVQKGLPYCPYGGKSALKDILNDGGFLSMDGMRIVKPIKDSNTTKVVDITATSSGELTKIINEWLQTNPGFKSQDVDIKGNILTGTFRLFINGGDVLVNYNPKSGGIIQHVLKVDRNKNTVTQNDVNNMIRNLYEHSEKVRQAESVKTPAKLLYCIIEFTESDYYGLISKVGKQISVDEAEKLIKNADAAKRAKSTNGTYDKTYLDIVVDWGGHKYRIHFLRFDCGDGPQYMNVKQQVNDLLKRVPDFMKDASYRNYVKQLDEKLKNMNDENIIIEKYKKVENGELIFGNLISHNGVFTFYSVNPSDDKDFSSLNNAQAYILSKNYTKL